MHLPADHVVNVLFAAAHTPLEKHLASRADTWILTPLGIDTVSQLRALSDAEMLAQRNIGPAVVAFVRRALAGIAPSNAIARDGR